MLGGGKREGGRGGAGFPEKDGIVFKSPRPERGERERGGEKETLILYHIPFPFGEKRGNPSLDLRKKEGEGP